MPNRNRPARQAYMKFFESLPPDRQKAHLAATLRWIVWRAQRRQSDPGRAGVPPRPLLPGPSKN